MSGSRYLQTFTNMTS